MKDRFDAFGVSGAKVDTEGEENGRYIRLMQSLNVEDKAQQDRLLNMLGDSVLKSLACRVVLDKEPEEDTAVHAFIEKLRELSSLHFVASRAA